ncbi:DUF3487 family protein [Vibrio mediterranei]|uniref:DUF3487 family protein n=1 Tax=Vibrio mediterranei TaxID=689 RepID=UPI0040686626
MSIEKEKTIPIVLDELDFEPNAFLGFTNMEFAMTIAAFSGIYSIAFIPLSVFLFSSGIYGLIGAIAVGVFSGVAGAGRAETLKKGRPSYMLWIDLKRKVQFEGIFGIRYDFGFITTKRWDVSKSEIE